MYFFPLSSFLFYQYVGFNISLLYRIYYVALSAILIYIFAKFTNKYDYSSLYGNLVSCIFLLTFLSIFWCYIFWGQSPVLSIRSTAPSLAIIYFVFLQKVKPTVQSVEKLMWFFCVLYVILWSYGVSQAPEMIFGTTDGEVSDDRGFFRVNLAGEGFCILGFFAGIGKYVETGKRKWIFLFVGLFIVILLHVTRQIIVFSLLVALIYLLKKIKYLWLFIGITIIILFHLSKIEISEDSVIGRLIILSEIQLDEHESGDENTRVSEYKYFFTEYPANFLAHFVGNGLPHKDSYFGEREAKIRNLKGFFWEDVGYAAIYVRIGFIGLVFYGLIFYRVIRQKVPVKYMYAKLYMIYMLLANVAASWIYSDVIAVCVCLYILECNHYKKGNMKVDVGIPVYDRNIKYV
jgi:hypothetical protein